ncbi:MAG: hypothetical protein QXF01_02580, partial [Candidatus Micrarchaeaceae archaeon]
MRYRTAEILNDRAYKRVKSAIQSADQEKALMEVRDYLKANGNSIAQDTKDALLDLSVMWGRDAIAKELMAYGANPNAKNEIQRTPIFTAVIYGRFNALMALHEGGGRFDVVD